MSDTQEFEYYSLAFWMLNHFYSLVIVLAALF